MPQGFWLSASRDLKDFLATVSLVIYYTWYILVPVILYLLFKVWRYWRQLAWAGTVKWSYIAISVPAESVKDPKSMEQVITGIHSIERSRNWIERNIVGQFQLSVSLEIVGINGHVRFIIRMPADYREAIETLIYAYYPEAEIMQVEDYASFAPTNYPDEEYEMYGTEAVLHKEDAYPIRTYLSFAEDIEKGFIDPVASLTEAMSSLGPGEQLWFQTIIRPRWDDKWKKDVLKLVDKLMKRPEEKGYANWFQKHVIGGWHGVEKNIDTSLGWPGVELEEEGNAPHFLSPGEREVLAAIEASMAKIAFQVKMRFVYIAKKEAFNKAKATFPMFTYLRLFSTEDLNQLKPNTKNWTSVEYFKKLRLPRRKRRMLKAFKSRDIDMLSKSYVFSTEEIATVYHFPYESVKAPTLERAEAKKAEPPADLPLE